jgi:hypothetical protein
MTLDGFLTFLALAVALWAVIPPVARLRVNLGKVLQLPLALIALIAVLYFEFFEALKLPCPSTFGTWCETIIFSSESKSITHAQAAFLAVVTWMFLAGLVYKFVKRGAYSLTSVSNLVDELVYEKKFAELIDFIKPNLPLIDKSISRNFRCQRLHDWIKNFNGQSLEASLQLWIENSAENSATSPKLKEKIYGAVKLWLSRTSLLIPSQNRSETAAQDIMRVLYGTDDLSQFIFKMRPYFALELLKLKQREKYDFSEKFFDALISNRGSVLYQELRNHLTVNDTSKHFYEHSRLLNFLFADCSVAESFMVWKPIEDRLLYILRSDTPRDYANFLNGQADNFEEECWQDPTYSTFCFFDLMIRAAAMQNTKYHMWLPYLPLFVERLLDLYDRSNQSIDINAEFPTRLSRLIYEAFSIQGKWIQIFRDLPKDSFHREVPDGFRLQHSTIPMSASVCLASCLKSVVTSTKINKSFAGYMLEVAMRDVMSLNHDDEKKIRNYLVQCLANGGDDHLHEHYGECLAILYPSIDHVLRYDAEDLGVALKAAYPNSSF